MDETRWPDVVDGVIQWPTAPLAVVPEEIVIDQTMTEETPTE